MRRLVCLIALLLSNALVLLLCLKLLSFSNRFALAIVVLAPMIFSMPWLIIGQEDR